jgi:glycosyltransferase involved in cell wall biosynthesis
MRFLFVKSRLAWPRSSGHDVISYGIMRALSELGHEIGLLTRSEPPSEAIEGLPLDLRATFDHLPVSSRRSSLKTMEKRYCSYWGIEESLVDNIGQQAKDWRADAVVSVGLEALPYLAGLRDCTRIWYAADEWVLHHLSQFRMLSPRTWENVRSAMVKGLYERVFASRVDRVWVVSERDAWAVKRVMGSPAVDTIVTGVDTDHYSPRTIESLPMSCVIWGRLDFGPNVDAIRWFASKVWPAVRQRFPEARFTVYGFNQTQEITELARTCNFQIIADLPDLRDAVCGHQIVVLPFVSGAGIKNKLLEAAAMGRPIVASRTAVNGLDSPEQLPFCVVDSTSQWLEALTDLWNDENKRLMLGSRARSWVIEKASWLTAARQIQASLEMRKR